MTESPKIHVFADAPAVADSSTADLVRLGEIRRRAHLALAAYLSDQDDRCVNTLLGIIREFPGAEGATGAAATLAQAALHPVLGNITGRPTVTPEGSDEMDPAAVEIATNILSGHLGGNLMRANHAAEELAALENPMSVLAILVTHAAAVIERGSDFTGEIWDAWYAEEARRRAEAETAQNGPGEALP